MKSGQDKIRSDQLKYAEEKIAIVRNVSSESLKARIRSTVQSYAKRGWTLERISCSEKFICLHFCLLTVCS